MTLAPSDLAAAYERDGYVTRLDIFSADEIAAFRAAFDELESREGREKCQIGLQNRHFDEEFIWRMATDGRVVDAIQACMGADVMLLATHFFCKYPDPEAKKFVAWHQDITYWGLEPPEAHTAWIAVDDAGRHATDRIEPGDRHAVEPCLRDQLQVSYLLQPT